MSDDASHPIHHFRTMGTFGELHLRAPEDIARPLFAEAEAELDRLCALMTRFDGGSPIEQLNDSGGGTVTGELREVLQIAHEGWLNTGGRFDIGVGTELIAAGYDRDFGELDVPADSDLPGSSGQPVMAPASAVTHAARSRPPFRMDAGGNLTIEPGVRLDLGGIGKGWSSDHVCRMLAPHGSCLVNLGGDIALSVSEGDEAWPIGVELGDHTTSLAIGWGGLATSGQDRRVWRDGQSGDLAHHIIDPSTGRPAATDILRITVFGSSCVESEIWSKALMMEGVDGAASEANAWGITCVIVGVDGRVALTGSLAGLEL